MPEEEPPHGLNAHIDAAVWIVGPLVAVVASPHEPPHFDMNEMYEL